MSWFSSAFHSIFGGGNKNAPPTPPPAVAPPSTALPILQSGDSATTEAALSTTNLPFINRRKDILASQGSSSIGSGLGSSSTLG